MSSKSCAWENVSGTDLISPRREVRKNSAIWMRAASGTQQARHNKTSGVERVANNASDIRPGLHSHGFSVSYARITRTAGQALPRRLRQMSRAGTSPETAASPAIRRCS